MNPSLPKRRTNLVLPPVASQVTAGIRYRRAVSAASSVLSYAGLILLALLVLVPLWWVMVSSFTTRETVWANVLPFSFRAFLPEEFTMSAYQEIFSRGFGRAIANTLFVGAVTVVLTILICAMAGFAFARFQFRGKNALWVLVLLTLMVPSELTVIPSYTLVSTFGWVNSWAALVVPAVGNATAIFLFRQFFAGIPQDLFDAARVDGAPWGRVFLNIVLPLSRPVMVTSGILIFLGQWNSFFWPMLVAPDAAYRQIQVAVAMIGVDQELTSWDLIFASSTIAALVPLLLVLPMQRFYVSSIMGSGIK